MQDRFKIGKVASFLNKVHVPTIGTFGIPKQIILFKWIEKD